MAWQNADRIGEREKLAPNAIEEQRTVPARKIPAPDSAGEKDIAAEERARGRVKETK